jgi:hypothetical protein
MFRPISREYVDAEGLPSRNTSATNSFGQVIRNSYQIKKNSLWGSVTEFYTNSYNGKCVKYILKLKHPTIHFTRILKRISIIVNEDELQFINGKALIIYNKMYHQNYMEHGLLVLPFVPYGSRSLSNFEEKTCAPAVIRLDIKNRFDESNLRYNNILITHIKEHLIIDLAYEVLSYLEFYNDEAIIVKSSIQIYTEKEFGGRPYIPQIYKNFYINRMHIHEDIVQCNLNSETSLMLPFLQPISQICIAFWEKNNFPNFIPHLHSLDLNIRDMCHLKLKAKKALIMDKLPYNIHIDKKNPVYTITFSNPSILEDSQPIQMDRKENDVDSDYHREIINSLPVGTLFASMPHEIHLSVIMNNIQTTPIMMGVWIIGINRFQLYNYSVMPYSYSFVRNFI